MMHFYWCCFGEGIQRTAGSPLRLMYCSSPRERETGGWEGARALVSVYFIVKPVADGVRFSKTTGQTSFDSIGGRKKEDMGFADNASHLCGRAGPGCLIFCRCMPGEEVVIFWVACVFRTLARISGDVEGEKETRNTCRSSSPRDQSTVQHDV